LLSTGGKQKQRNGVLYKAIEIAKLFYNTRTVRREA
jgi:hypothetical protein